MAANSQLQNRFPRNWVGPIKRYKAGGSFSLLFLFLLVSICGVGGGKLGTIFSVSNTAAGRAAKTLFFFLFPPSSFLLYNIDVPAACLHERCFFSFWASQPARPRPLSLSHFPIHSSRQKKHGLLRSWCSISSISSSGSSRRWSWTRNQQQQPAPPTVFSGFCFQPALRKFAWSSARCLSCFFCFRLPVTPSGRSERKQRRNRLKCCSFFIFSVPSLVLWNEFEIPICLQAVAFWTRDFTIWAK